MGDFEKRWEDAKTEFENQTGQKKPTAEYKKFRKKRTAIAKLLKSCDAAQVKCSTAAAAIDRNKAKNKGVESPQDIDAFKETVAAFEKAKDTAFAQLDTYADTLDKALPPGKKVAQNLLSKEKTVWDRAIKYLEREIPAIKAIIDQQYTTYVKRMDADYRALSVKEKQCALWDKNMKSVLAKSLATVAKLKVAAAKAQKDPSILPKAITAYNSAIPAKAGRDINMQVVNAEKGIPAINAEAKRIKRQTEPWNTSNTHSLADSASAEELVAKIKQFSQHVKAVAAWYKDDALPKL